jgi:hypothetical protein
VIGVSSNKEVFVTENNILVYICIYENYYYGKP